MYSEHNGYGGYPGYGAQPQPPKKSGGAWKIIVAVAAVLVILTAIICSTALFATWLKSYYAGRNDPELSTPTTSQTTLPDTAPATTPPETTRRPAATLATDATVPGDVLSVSEIYTRNVDAVVSITVKGVSSSGWMQMPFTASGTGFVISEDGYILTCYHVIEDYQSIRVALYNGTEYDASYIGGDEALDIAVIRIDAAGLKSAALGDSDEIVIGEDAIVIGNPLQLTFSVSRGIVSATDRVIDVDSNDSISVFQLDAAVNSGNSGGPVFNDRGEVIGMIDAKYASEGVEGLGFALPINQVMDIADDLITYGYVTGRPYFGISASTASTQRGFAVNGARVESVDASSCAAKAGLQVGDIITALDDTEITSVSDLISAKDDYSAGDTARLTVWRSGASLTLTITFDEARS